MASLTRIVVEKYTLNGQETRDMLKPDENPPLTWPDKGIQNYNGTWWVVHCKSRNEKALAWDMINKEINYFLPMSWKTNKCRGRTIKTLLPLFSGYIFFCGDESQRLEVFKTNRVANIIEVQDQEQLFTELEAIEKALDAGFALQPWQQSFTGCSHRIISGPLVDTEGQIIHIDGKTYLVLTVGALGLSTSLEILPDMLEKLELKHA